MDLWWKPIAPGTRRICSPCFFNRKPSSTSSRPRRVKFSSKPPCSSTNVRDRIVLEVQSLVSGPDRSEEISQNGPTSSSHRIVSVVGKSGSHTTRPTSASFGFCAALYSSNRRLTIPGAAKTSSSTIRTTSFVAAFKPVFSAAARPLFRSWRMTRTFPGSLTGCGEPSSTTMISASW